VLKKYKIGSEWLILVIISSTIGFLIGIIILTLQEKNSVLFLSSLSSLITIIPAIFIVYTLYEMREQRQAMYKPSLFLKKGDFYLRWDPEKNNPLIFKCCNTTDSLFIDAKKDSAKIKVVNVGLGPAKLIKCSFEYDYEVIMGEILQYSDLNGLRIKGKNPFSISNGSLQINLSNFRNFTEIQYILPVNKKNEYEEIPIPVSLLFLYSTQRYLHFNNKNSGISAPSIPNVKILLKFRDIANNEYEETHTLIFEHYGVQTNLFGNMSHEYIRYAFVN